MIAMGVRKNDRINMAYIFTQHLLTKIRARINNKILTGYFYPYGRPQSFVSIVKGIANLTRAANYGHTL